MNPKLHGKCDTEGKLTHEECNLHMAPLLKWASAVSGTTNSFKYRCCLFVYKGLKRLEKKGKMLKDKSTKKHLPFLLVKNSEQVLSACYCCYQPISKAVGNTLIMQKFQSDFSVYSNYCSDTYCGPNWLPYHSRQVCRLFRVYWLLNFCFL